MGLILPLLNQDDSDDIEKALFESTYKLKGGNATLSMTEWHECWSE